ncbi:hypothetical protein D3C81_2028240 [compost metagenome]
MLVVNIAFQYGKLFVNPEGFQRGFGIGGLLQHPTGHGMILVNVHELLGDVQIGGDPGEHQQGH